MSTVDRYEVFRGSCLCGAGTIVVNECSPDHPWVRQSQYWWETEISCPKCKDEYAVNAGHGFIQVFRQSDLKEKEERGHRWHRKLEEIYNVADGQGYTTRLAAHVDSLKSVAEIHRQIGRFTSSGSSYQTFRRSFHRGGNTKDWIRRNIMATTLPKGLEQMLRIRDSDLDGLIAESDRLFNEYQKEPEPIKILK